MVSDDASQLGGSKPAEAYSQSQVTCGCVKLVQLKPRTQLYHYLPLAPFLAWVESREIALRQVKLWQDRWEQPFRRIRVETGEASAETVRRYEDTFGHSWTRSRESDAMWRLYSPDGLGLRVATTAERFSLLGGLCEAVLAPVWYGNEPVIRACLHDSEFPRAGYVDAFLKRPAFRYEREVRLIVDADQCLPGVRPEGGVLRLPLDPARLVSGIALDPRAEEWFLEAMRRFCARSGLKCVPALSGLHSEAPLDAGLFPESRHYL